MTLLFALWITFASPKGNDLNASILPPSPPPPPAITQTSIEADEPDKPTISMNESLEPEEIPALEDKKEQTEVQEISLTEAIAKNLNELSAEAREEL